MKIEGSSLSSLSRKKQENTKLLESFDREEEIKYSSQVQNEHNIQKLWIEQKTNIQSREKYNSQRKIVKGPPAILDTDYGSFIDDVFALGLMLNTEDIIDFQYIVTTAENPVLASKCVSKHLEIAQVSHIGVGVGATLPPHEERAGFSAVPGSIGFALEQKCVDVNFEEAGIDKDGISIVASLILDSGRDDWVYLAVGGQTSVRKLVENYPEAAGKIETLVIMGGNFCADFYPYPNVLAPTDETNISCDPFSANFILNKEHSPFKNIYYTPVEVASEIGGEDYAKIVEAARDGYKSANATIEFYYSWNNAARAAGPGLLVHHEAMMYNPETESTPQYDACAIMFALELYDDKKCEDRLVYYEFEEGIRFTEPIVDSLAASPDEYIAGLSLLSDRASLIGLPEQCPSLSPLRFNPNETSSDERSVFITLGYTNQNAKNRFFSSMASRMAGNLNNECA